MTSKSSETTRLKKLLQSTMEQRDMLYAELLRLHSPNDPGMPSISESPEPLPLSITIEDLVEHSKTWGSLRLIVYTAEKTISMLKTRLAEANSNVTIVKQEYTRLEAANADLLRQYERLLKQHEDETAHLKLVVEDKSKQVADLLATIEAYKHGPGLSHKLLTERIVKWVHRCLGEPLQSSPWERGMRLVEEAMEMGQCLGITQGDFIRLVKYVCNRPVGNKGQEAAGVLVTLLAACDCANIDIAEEVEKEVSRIENQEDRKVQEKQAFKASINTGMIPTINQLPELDVTGGPPPTYPHFQVKQIIEEVYPNVITRQTASVDGPRSRYTPEEDEGYGLD